MPSKPSPHPRSKYDALARHLDEVSADTVTMSFDEVAALVGGLPPSARDHQAWWANEESGSHVQARAWMGSGWRVDSVDQKVGRVGFRRG